MESVIDIIQSDVGKVFGEECIMTGENIKNSLRDIYSQHNLKASYFEIKDLEKFGYSLTRFLDDGKFKYKIIKNDT